MSVRALGIALKLTFSGVNQLVYLQTWIFTVIVAACVVTQINYLNKVRSFFLNFLLANVCVCGSNAISLSNSSRHLTPSTQQLYRLYTMLCSHHSPSWQVLLCSRYTSFLLLLLLFSG
jgi:Magnesium transporter NIPA